MRMRMARLQVQRLRRPATLTRQEAPARVLQQWWCVTHPPPVASSAVGYREHAAAFDVSSGLAV